MKAIVLFVKSITLAFQKSLFCFCTINLFLFICKNVVIIANFMLIINIYLSSFFTLKIVCFLYSEHGWLHSYKLYMMMIKKIKKKVKIYQMHLPPTTQFNHRLICKYDILVFLKVGCSYLPLK